MKKFGLTILLLAFFSGVSAQSEKIKIAKLQYSGGGDWYANKTALPNLAKFCNEQLGTTIDEENAVVTVGSPELFNYAFVYMTGHGNVVFSPSEAENLRKYLTSGGFLHIDDNYGLNDYIRLEMKKVFPELEFIELPHDHPIYHQKFNFPNGIPKIHEHDNKPAQGFGLIYEGKLVCYFSYESDLGNGWEDQRIHNDPEEVRLKALQMGANLITYIFTEL
ncbi:DUF4159 domain-containing protein [Roseivirga spongicola]|uniref:DUF4159 domain-containing protein n=1 Tax=Roseivirga spongicola TaxID=333140 RepID=A0A150X1N1_9BACT|nr:DUF4159 domain-containing protein [Roseivirga spongicola]KYG72623.1 hypothetical protein AWW68_17115 [Roseivirga spongicola]WPZ10221.1 DUF4159 domain-containing protein [Roseivirga spongicola]